MTFIERVGQKRAGFWCWKLFTVNYLRSYEVRKLYRFTIQYFQETISKCRCNNLELLRRHPLNTYIVIGG